MGRFGRFEGSGKAAGIGGVAAVGDAQGNGGMGCAAEE